MEVSARTLREVVFREKMRGYHPEDVDQFLEQVAAGVEALQDRLRQAVERAQRAEAALAEGGTDETLKKTLVLAARTADMAVAEAREQAARILAGAEAKAQSVIAEAEEHARRTFEEAVAASRVELDRLSKAAAAAASEVAALNDWIEEHRGHLRQTLVDALETLERVGSLRPAPISQVAEAPERPSRGAQTGGHNGEPEDPPPHARLSDAPAGGEDTMAWDKPAEEAGLRPAPEPPDPPSGPTPRQRYDTGPESVSERERQALDEFFDDDEIDLSGEIPAGRLRRRRRG